MDQSIYYVSCNSDNCKLIHNNFKLKTSCNSKFSIAFLEKSNLNIEYIVYRKIDNICFQNFTFTKSKIVKSLFNNYMSYPYKKKYFNKLLDFNNFTAKSILDIVEKINKLDIFE